MSSDKTLTQLTPEEQSSLIRILSNSLYGNGHNVEDSKLLVILIGKLSANRETRGGHWNGI
jgi:hypothetical protein